jgi:hypothetical protein
MVELFSHCISPSATLRRVVCGGLDNELVQRLSSAAGKRVALLELLHGVHITTAPD